MKRKQIKLSRKLLLGKELIAPLTSAEGNLVKGGATLMGDTTPCHPCTAPPTIVTCTENTCQNPCVVNGSIRIDSGCPGIC